MFSISVLSSLKSSVLIKVPAGFFLTKPKFYIFSVRVPPVPKHSITAEVFVDCFIYLEKEKRQKPDYICIYSIYCEWACLTGCSFPFRIPDLVGERAV